MQLKDYYKILELEPSANLTDIKKSYRRLAQQFHPDKTHNDPYASARFDAIKEAYEVLTNPSKKAYYLQQRWYNQSTGIRKTQEIVTPASVIKQALELEKYVSRLDQFRMDKYGLHDYIAGLISDSNIATLNQFNDTGSNEQIIDIVLKCLKPLPLDLVLSLEKKLSTLNTGPAAKEKLISFIAEQENNHSRDRLRVWILLLTTLLLCLLIYFLSR